METAIQDKNTLSREVQDVLGKKFSWIITHGNALLMLSIIIMWLVATLVEIPVSIKANGNATLIPSKQISTQNYTIRFDVPVQQIAHFNEGTTLQIFFSHLPEQGFEAKVNNLGTEIVDGKLAVYAFSQTNIAAYSKLNLKKCPVSIELPIGKKNIIHYLIN